MTVISIGSDRSLFKPGSAARVRAAAYAEALGELHIIVFALRAHQLQPAHAGPLHLYPTDSRSRLGFVFDAARLARRMPGEVITVQDPFESGLAGILGRKHRPLHVQLHTDPFAPAFRASLLNRIRLMIAPYVFTRAAGIRTLTETLKGEIARVYQPKAPISVLPIYVDLARFSSVNRVPEPGNLLFVGRLEWEKDPFLALEAFAKARKEGVEAHLTFLGDGSLRQALEKRAAHLGIREAVAFFGQSDPVPEFARAALLLATSRYEGYGLAIVEALAARVAVLSTDVGVAREAGAIISTPETFADTLIALLRAGLQAGHLASYPYRDFEHYLAAYVADIEQCANQSLV